MRDDRRTVTPLFVSRCMSYADLFGAQVAKSPKAIALICGEQKLTFQELNERANRLAGYLISLGVGPDMPVGVCASRSLDMVVAILGIIVVVATMDWLSARLRERMV